MKKAAIASLLAVSSLMFAPGAGLFAGTAHAQAAASQVQMDPDEFKVYDDAVNKQTTPQTQAPALEAYLAKYPKSAVKADVLHRIMIAYSQFDHPKAITAADNVLQLSPNDMQAILIEVAYRSETNQLDSASDFAQKGLKATKPDGMSDADFKKLKDYATPTFYSTIGAAKLKAKDSAGAIEAYKSELSFVPVEATQTVGTPLADTFALAQTYYTSTPPDYINCTFYATRAAAYAPDPYKGQWQPVANYCYKKYHGGMDGYDAVVAVAKANLNPPADFKITPAPTAEDQVKQLLASTSEEDLPKLAIDDKEYVIANGSQDQADKVFNTVKGKSTEFPDMTVVSATADVVQVSVSQDAIQNKTADFTFNMKSPLKTIPATGSKVTLSGTYASYTAKPLMITMSDGEEVTKKAPAKAPVKKAPVRRR